MSQQFTPQAKGHHYVPKSYLKRFTDSKGNLYIRDMARNHIAARMGR